MPDGQSCVLTGTQAQGTVQVGTGATLQADGVTVNGNIQAEGAAAVTVADATVGGSIQIKQGGAATVTGVQVTGDIQFDENSGALAAGGNQVGGNLQAFKNSGGLAINNNTIGGNLQCKENNPAPTGSGNQAASLEDQCAGLGSGDGGGNDDDVKRYGRITSFPPAPYTGTWVINGVSYTADGSTQFEQEYGAFAEGICVEVEFAAAAPAPAKKIETEEDYKCSGRTGDDDDDAEGELYGVVTELPTGLVGTWVIGGKSFEATAQTEFDDEGGTFAKGVTVKVEFTTDSAGVNHATEIELKYGDDDDDDDDDDEYGEAPGAEGQAYGLLESRPAERNGEWVIGGIAYVVDDGSELDDAAELVVGARVKVEYTVRSDGTRRAHEIEATGDDGEVDDDANSKLVGFVQQMPAVGFMGSWKIAGLEFEAGLGTKFEQEYGAFAVGSYVEVEYRMEGSTRRIYKIETHVPPGAGTDDDLGRIQSIGGQVAAAAPSASVWQIDGVGYFVTPATQLLDRGGEL
ncbi:MAG: hypothetical protein IT329_23255, partial [Caldilineaceae bacterium]|nr:hypothetical protein [Caldilineaceae bacterium]